MALRVWRHIGVQTQHIPAERCDRDSDQRGQTEKHRESRLRDNEAGRPGEQAARKGAKRGQKGVLAGGELRRSERRHIVDEHHLREGVGETLYADRGGEVTWPRRLSIWRKLWRGSQR